MFRFNNNDWNEDFCFDLRYWDRITYERVVDLLKKYYTDGYKALPAKALVRPAQLQGMLATMGSVDRVAFPSIPRIEWSKDIDPTTTMDAYIIHAPWQDIIVEVVR
jgi:hypothetical protein